MGPSGKRSLELHGLEGSHWVLPTMSTSMGVPALLHPTTSTAMRRSHLKRVPLTLSCLDLQIWPVVHATLMERGVKGVTPEQAAKMQNQVSVTCVLKYHAHPTDSPAYSSLSVCGGAGDRPDCSW